MSKYQPIYRISQIRKIEKAAATSGLNLMKKAGSCVALYASKILSEGGKNILIACGHGNNGGDGWIAARNLQKNGHKVTVLYKNLPKFEDATQVLDEFRSLGGIESDSLDKLKLQNFDLIVDAIFGIGLTPEVDHDYAAWIKAFNKIDCLKLSVDIPSGLSADTGSIYGCAFRATHTITFIGLKPGLLTLDGPDYCGQIKVDDLGVCGMGGGSTVESDLFEEVLKPRLKNTHKGTFGTVGVIGGAKGMVGAVLLAGRAAFKVGAGRVVLCPIDKRLVVDYMMPQLMINTNIDEVIKSSTVLALGPGLGKASSTLKKIKNAIKADLPTVLDADGLRVLLDESFVKNVVFNRKNRLIITPHPKEAAMLLGCSTAEIQKDRIKSAITLAKKFNASVVLKGCGSIIANTDGAWFINTYGNPSMASAGMGDVLTGMIASILAQNKGIDSTKASLCGVYMHSKNADLLINVSDFK